MKFNKEELIALNEAIRYYRGREGNFNSNDPLVDLTGKLSRNNSVDFNLKELELLKNVLDENIVFIKNYNYKVLTEAQSKKNKKRILLPLLKIRDRINEEV